MTWNKFDILPGGICPKCGKPYISVSASWFSKHSDTSKRLFYHSLKTDPNPRACVVTTMRQKAAK